MGASHAAPAGSLVGEISIVTGKSSTVQPLLYGRDIAAIDDALACTAGPVVQQLTSVDGGNLLLRGRIVNIPAGAQFIVTPGSTRELLLAALDNPLPLLPGVSSASELMVGYALGYRRFKLFPAEVCGGVAALKALAGPFGGVRFCPTGGITPDNLQRYMAQPNVMCVGGTWMFQREWVENSDWARIQQCSVEALQLLG